MTEIEYQAYERVYREHHQFKEILKRIDIHYELDRQWQSMITADIKQALGG